MRNILWLDDQFGIDPNLDKEVNGLYEELALATNLTDEEVMKEYNIVTVTNYPEFKLMMKEAIFDAVILDIDGMGEADREERSLDGFYNSRQDAITKKTSIVIYSGQVEESEREIKGFLSSIKNKNIECKVVRKIEGVEKLCEALMDIFDNDIWTKFPQIRKLIELEELSKWIDTLKEILQSYVKCEYSSDIAKKFRDVLVEIVKKLKYDFRESFEKYLNRNGKVNYSGTDNNLIKWTLEACCCQSYTNDKELRDEHLIIPSTVMPREVKFALKYIWELSNIYHHVSSDDHCTIDFKNIMLDSSKDDLERVNRMSYDSFILILEWYYGQHATKGEL